MKRAAICLLVAAVTACSEGPTSGELSLRMTSPRNGDRAILLRVVGRQRGVTPGVGTAYRVYADSAPGGDTTLVAVIAPAGSGLVSGEVARISVPDTRRAGSYTASVLQIAAADYSLVDSAGVTLSVVKP